MSVRTLGLSSLFHTDLTICAEKCRIDNYLLLSFLIFEDSISIDFIEKLVCYFLIGLSSIITSD